MKRLGSWNRATLRSGGGQAPALWYADGIMRAAAVEADDGPLRRATHGQPRAAAPAVGGADLEAEVFHPQPGCKGLRLPQQRRLVDLVDCAAAALRKVWAVEPLIRCRLAAGVCWPLAGSGSSCSTPRAAG